MAEYDNERRTGFDTKLTAEANAVLTNAAFLRSPVLSKLLRYLLNETVKGHGDALKSYAVAVDGLGRPETFDSASDSSARVQMVRLRKALESHYAQHGPTDDQCIYLQPGSYRVRLGKLATAYPSLYRPLSDTNNVAGGLTGIAVADLTPAVPDSDSNPAVPVASKSRFGFKARNVLVGTGVAIGLAAALLVWFGWHQLDQRKALSISPVLELMPIENADAVALAQPARIVSSVFADGLPRFKLARVSVLSDPDDALLTSGGATAYRLFTQIEQRDPQSYSVFLRLADTGSSTTIWSREVSIPNQPEAIANTLAPILAEINGPFGAIATHSMTVQYDTESGGYPCLIKYFAFLRTRDRDMQSRVAACLQKTGDEPRMRATILAARAFFALETEDSQSNFPLALFKANKLAQLAVAADPDDGAARYAMARIAYFRRDCVTARYYTRQAVEANPNSPIIIGNLASLANQCAYKDAGKLLDRAFLIQGASNANGRLLLVLASISQGRTDRIAELSEMTASRSGTEKANYYLTETLIAAAQKRPNDAARNWTAFSRALPPNLKTPNQKLQRIILSPAMRGRLVQYLAANGAFVLPRKK